MQFADEEFSVLIIAFYAWDVENTWLIISFIWISGCRYMKGTQISNTRKHRKHSGLRTD
jgi:hypothetical protein